MDKNVKDTGKEEGVKKSVEAKCDVETIDRRVESGEWRLESGEWRLESGEWAK
jgi:hypothetical protein